MMQLFTIYLLLITRFITFSEGAIKLYNDHANLLDDAEPRAKEKITVTYFDFHKFNRTTKALSVNFTLFHDVTTENDIVIKSMFYLWKNNEYKKTPITWEMKVCGFLDKGSFAIQSLLKDSSVDKCPLKKGNHYIKNLSPPDLEGWPSIIPEGKWKLVIKYYIENVYCFTVEWVAVITKN